MPSCPHYCFLSSLSDVQMDTLRVYKLDTLESAVQVSMEAFLASQKCMMQVNYPYNVPAGIN